MQRAQIVELACLEPIAKGLHITHWSSEDLACQAVDDKILPAISAATVRRILQDVDLQPHRTRYWKTARLDARFKERAEQVLWCYYPGNQDPHKSLQPIRSSNSRSWLPRDQRSTTESAEIHGKENPNQLPLSVSFRVFRGYPFVLIILAGVIWECGSTCPAGHLGCVRR